MQRQIQQVKQKKPKPNKQDYQSLKEVWYKKLERSGFEDIEKDELNLKQYSSRFNQDAVVRNWYAKREYYSMAGQFLHTYKFGSNLEKVIWEYHTESISVRNIAKLLNKTKVTKTNKDKVLAVITKLDKEMYKLFPSGYNKERYNE